MTDEIMNILGNYFIDEEVQASEGLPESFRQVAIDGMKEYWRQNPDVFERQWAEFLELSVPTRRIYG